MPVLRILLAGLMALVAMAAVFFTAVAVLFAGAVAWVLQLFRPHRSQTGRPPGRRVDPRAGDVIDI